LIKIGCLKVAHFAASVASTFCFQKTQAAHLALPNRQTKPELASHRTNRAAKLHPKNKFATILGFEEIRPFYWVDKG
jgi:hypothetical protein